MSDESDCALTEMVVENRERIVVLEEGAKIRDGRVDEVEKAATAAARFVRRVIIGAAGAIGGSVIAAVILIYQAGYHAAEGRAKHEADRVDVLHKIEKLEDALTDLRDKVKLLLRTP